MPIIHRQGAFQALTLGEFAVTERPNHPERKKKNNGHGLFAPTSYQVRIYWLKAASHWFTGVPMRDGRPLAFHVVGVPKYERHVDGNYYEGRFRVDGVWPLDDLPTGLTRAEKEGLRNAIYQRVAALVAPLNLALFSTERVDWQ